MGRALRPVLAILCVTLSLAAIYNVLGDNAEVQALAGKLACGDLTPCKAQMTRLERTPFAQTYDMTTPKRTVTVRCARSLVFVGEYACSIP